jgi:uncharacterized cupin superfamily protein
MGARMGERRSPALDAMAVEARNSTIYPAAYAGPIAGRSKRALGDAFGLTQFGVNLTTLAPGAWSSQRHWHEREDEFIYVTDGEITLIDDDGEHLLKAGTCAGFKAGSTNAHHLVNKSSRPAAYVEVGHRSAEEGTHYAEADMKGLKRGGKWTITRKDGTPF